MTPHQVEAALARAAAIALLGDRAAPAERQEAARTLAWLDWIPNERRRRATAMRIIPCRRNGAPHGWAEIATALRVSRHTALAWHQSNLLLLAARLAEAPTDA
jgi:hypothetical protein